MIGARGNGYSRDGRECPSNLRCTSGSTGARSGTGGASVRCRSISMLTWTALRAAEEDSWSPAIRVGPNNSLAWEKTNRWVYGSEALFLRLREQGSISLLSALEPPREQEIDVPETWRHSSPPLE